MSTKSWRDLNPEKMKEYRRKWYYKNRESALGHQKRMTKVRAKKAKEFLEEFVKPCLICQESEPACIDFHHLDPKTKFSGVKLMASSGYSKHRILEEVAKCVCLCSNCHRKLHAGKLALPEGIAPS